MKKPAYEAIDMVLKCSFTLHKHSAFSKYHNVSSGTIFEAIGIIFLIQWFFLDKGTLVSIHLFARMSIKLDFSTVFNFWFFFWIFQFKKKKMLLRLEIATQLRVNMSNAHVLKAWLKYISTFQIYMTSVRCLSWIQMFRNTFKVKYLRTGICRIHTNGYRCIRIWFW